MRYARLSIALHWLMLALLVAVYATIELREFFPKGSIPRESLKSWHFMLGLSVFVLVWARIAARLVWPAPRPEVSAASWQRISARTTHFLLYVLMAGMPLAGWMILSAEGKAIPFFGLELSPLIRRDNGLAENVEELHELGGAIGYWLVGLHASAALFHHYVIKDNLLNRMLPARA